MRKIPFPKTPKSVFFGKGCSIAIIKILRAHHECGELFTVYRTLGPASTTSCGVPSVNLAKFWMKRKAKSL